MSELETVIINTAKGLYREDRENSGYNRASCLTFEQGQAIKIDPFADQLAGSEALWPVYGEFREYVNPKETLAKVYIPPKSNNEPVPTWFKEEAGEYIIHEGYITSQ